MRNGGSVLVVDDEFLIAELMSTMARDLGLDVCGTAATADAAVALANAYLPSLVLMDVHLRNRMDGIEAAKTITRSVGAAVIFITGSGEPAALARLKRADPAAVLTKPVRFDDFKTAVMQAMARGRRGFVVPA